MSLKPLTPPLRFSTVAFAGTDQSQQNPRSGGNSEDAASPRSHPHHRESVYRGAYPKARNLSFLSRLHLRTVLSLTPRPLDNDAALLTWSSPANTASASSSTAVADKASKLGIQLLHVRCEKPKDESGGLTREGAARALSILLDRRNHPIYIHCLDGVEVTSTLVACMRKVQAWSDPSILAELGRALRDSNSSEWTEVPSHLSAFLSKFGQPDGIRLPPRSHIPSWLWPAPNPLSILADPYAWAGSAHPTHLVAGHAPNGVSSTSASSTETPMSRGSSQANNGPSDLSNGVASTTASHLPIPPHHRRERQLPIHHPTLKLSFDIDPNLPLEPVASAFSAASAALAAASSAQRPMTPSRAAHHHSLASTYNTNASLRTPPQSRPASRAGRPSTSSSLSAANRSASMAPDESTAGTSSARTPSGTTRGSASSLISPSPASSALHLSVSAIPSVAAFLEDQVQDRVAAGRPFLLHHESESPTRRSRSDLGAQSRLDSPQSDKTHSISAQASVSDQHAATITAPIETDTDDTDVSTPRARPTTSSNYDIGIAGTIFHHDDDITDNEAEHMGSTAIRDMNTARIVVPLEQRRRRPMLDEADGEQTPTKANALAQRQSLHVIRHATAETPSDRAPRKQSSSGDPDSAATSSANKQPQGSLLSARSSFDEQRSDDQSEDIVQSPACYGIDGDNGATDSDHKSDGYQDEEETEAIERTRAQTDRVDDADEADEEQEEQEENEQEEDDEDDEDDEEEEEEDDEEEEEEEDDEEEEEDEEEDEDEDDLALEALDLEGY